MSIQFYAVDLTLIPILISIAVIISQIVVLVTPDRAIRVSSSILAVLSAFLIVKYTLLGRTSSEVHQFIFFAPYSNEFWREMIMNLVLFFPLGLCLPYSIKRYWTSVIIAFIFAGIIETWQYLMGTGVAQGTDVIMNTLGAAIGGISFLISKEMEQRKNRKESQ